jgi:hypothetical protein
MRVFFVVLFLVAGLVSGCESRSSFDNRVEIINNGLYQQITVTVNGFLQERGGKTVFGPSESLGIYIGGDLGDETVILVRIYDLNGYYLNVETRSYRKQDYDTNDTWVIANYYNPYNYYY